MNVTTLNVISLDDGRIIKKGGGGGGVTINNQDKVVDITENGTTEVVADGGYTGLGKVTINTEVSGGGGTDLEGEYFLAKPNGRYWKFTFMPEGYRLRIEDFESSQIDAMYQTYTFLIALQCVFGAAASSDDANIPESHVRVDGFYEVGFRMKSAFNCIDLYINGRDYNKQTFNNGFLRVWKECDVKSNPPIEIPNSGGLSLNSCSLVEFVKVVISMQGMEMTDDEVIMFIEQQFMLIPATEEEYKYWRFEFED